jgi:excisionase family DNA binding protein
MHSSRMTVTEISKRLAEGEGQFYRMLEEKISPALRVGDLRILRAGLSKMGGELGHTGSRMRPPVRPEE